MWKDEIQTGNDHHRHAMVTDINEGKGSNPTEMGTILPFKLQGCSLSDHGG